MATQVLNQTVSELCQNPICFGYWELSSEKQMPQVIVNKAKWKEGIEGLELFRKLAKQVLSQLSYTPTVRQQPF
jgi:hypothetical protein